MDVFKNVDSLATAFNKQPKAKEVYRKINPSSRVINNYIVAAELVRDGVHCFFGNKCKWYTAGSDQKSDEALLKFVLCISCDRVSHLSCTGADFSSIPENQLPWTCANCISNPLNSDAQSLVAAKRHLLPFDERIKHFIKVSDPDDTENDDDSNDDPENKSIHLDTAGKVVSNKYETQIQKLMEKLEETMKENKALHERLEAIGPFAQTSSVINPPGGNVNDSSYTAAILHANAQSTRIEDVERHSQQLLRDISHSARPESFSSTAAQAGNLGGNNCGDQQFSFASQSCQETTQATLKHLNLMTLNEIRRNLPKIETFDGRPEKWIQFKRAVERNWKEGQFSDALMKNHIRQALSGKALARVDELFDFMSASRIMDFLRDSFGNSSIVVESARQRLLSVKLSKPLTHASCVEVTTLIATYMSACTYAGLLVADSSISTKLHHQLEPFHQQAYYEFFFHKFPDATTRVERLDVQFDFLNSISRTLPIGSFSKPYDEKPKETNKSLRQQHKQGNEYQVMSATVNSSGVSSTNKSSTGANDDYKYKILDLKVARYVGYDLDELKEVPRKCEICTRPHYTIECQQYRDMRMDERFNLAKSKNLCVNCMLTSAHSSSNCNLKMGCGYKLNKNVRCTAKHHVTLHRNSSNGSSNGNSTLKKQQRRSRSNSNADKANHKLEVHRQQQQSNNNSHVLQQQSTSTTTDSTEVHSHVPLGNSFNASVGTVSHASKPYQLCTINAQTFTVSESSSRTVKLFRTYFYGNAKKAIGHSLGDSGSEITLVKRELIDDLGLTGEIVNIILQWTGAEIKSTTAMKVNMKVSGIFPGNQVLELTECYAVQDLELQPRTLNVENLKRQFAHLRKIPFESYENAVPSMLIGTRHAAALEAIEPAAQAGLDKPVGVKTLLGYSIYGGAPETCLSPYSVNLHTMKEDVEDVKEVHDPHSQLESIYSYNRSIDSKNNAADLATKFQKFDFGDINSKWYQGPPFLKLTKDHWPAQKFKVPSESLFLGYVNQESLCTDRYLPLPPVDCPFAPDTIIDLLSAGIQSRWIKLVRAIGRALKFYFEAIVPLLKSKKWHDVQTRNMIRSTNDFIALSPAEMERAELFIIRRMQREAYPEEYERLRNNKRISNKELLMLNVFMDSNGIIRISSRVDLPFGIYAQKFSPVVPRKSRFSTALFFYYHYKYKHVGLETQMADIRSRFWVPQLRQAVRRVKALCNHCGFLRAHPVEYPMAPLPRVRVDCRQSPFQVVGLDCAGPYTVRAKNGHLKKVWILIFTCTWSRFIHLHLLDTLSSLAVLEAIFTVYACHGPISQFISDNGTNFVGVANIFQQDRRELIEFLRNTGKEIESVLTEKKSISWKFIPVQSPWFGGFYERLIDIVKESIASSVEGKTISRTEFSIALQDAAHRINCRPLTHVSIDHEDEEVLTPHHLAKGRSGFPIIPSNPIDAPDPRKDRNEYRRGRILAHEITRKFITHYLPVLTKRTKWFKDFAPIRTGDLVLVIDPNKTKEAWERARVQTIYYSKDANARVVDLLYPDGTVRKNRSVKRLAKLEIHRI